MTAKKLQKMFPRVFNSIKKSVISDAKYQIANFPINKAIENIAHNVAFCRTYDMFKEADIRILNDKL